MTKITENDKAWFAAILDQKGNTVRKTNKMRRTPQLVLYVESRYNEVVKQLGLLTGINFEPQDEKKPIEWIRRGCTEHCPEKHLHAERHYDWSIPRTYRWVVTGAGAVIVLHNTLPLMETDRDFRDLYAEGLQNTVTTGQGWGAVRKTIKRLYDLGWDLPNSYARLDFDDE